MKNDDTVTLVEFAKYIGANHSYLCNLCLYPTNRNDITATSERKYNGIPLPLPISGSFLTARKEWWREDVIAFKKLMDAQLNTAK